MVKVKKVRICGDLKRFMNEDLAQSDDCVNYVKEFASEPSSETVKVEVVELVEELAA